MILGDHHHHFRELDDFVLLFRKQEKIEKKGKRNRLLRNPLFSFLHTLHDVVLYQTKIADDLKIRESVECVQRGQKKVLDHTRAGKKMSTGRFWNVNYERTRKKKSDEQKKCQGRFERNSQIIKPIF